jgi:hypothetical protein
VGAEPVTRLAGKPRGLAHAGTSFVGRSGAVGKVADLLGTYRLVTITGPGGVGKTRLADEVLKQVADRFADGAGIVELAAVSEPALVAATVATALDVRQAPGMSISDALAERLSLRQMLLVLDNCEHVLDAAAQLCGAVLSSADDVRILVTSREPLGLPEEARYRLSPLGLPDRDVPGPTAQAEAVTLFAERARQLDPDFTVDGDSGAMVARLVQRLDGMPLAIELAAARVEALGAWRGWLLHGKVADVHRSTARRLSASSPPVPVPAGRDDWPQRDRLYRRTVVMRLDRRPGNLPQPGTGQLREPLAHQLGPPLLCHRRPARPHPDRLRLGNVLPSRLAVHAQALRDLAVVPARMPVDQDLDDVDDVEDSPRHRPPAHARVGRNRVVTSAGCRNVAGYALRDVYPEGGDGPGAWSWSFGGRRGLVHVVRRSCRRGSYQRRLGNRGF